MKHLHRYSLLPVALLSLSMIAGCDREPLRVYQAPKDQSPPAPTASSAQPAQPARRGGDAAAIQWTLPEGWTQQPGTGMRFATILIPGEKPVELRVTPLAPMAGEIAPNVQRWAGQVGLETLSAEQISQMVKPVTVHGRQAHIASITGPAVEGRPAMQALAAIIPGDEQVWFFAIIDEAARIAPHQEAFTRLIETVRFVQPQQPEPAAAAAAPTDPSSMKDATGIEVPQSGGTITYEKPQSWSDDPNKSTVRVASFLFKDEHDSGEVAVTRFPGTVGGLLSNINRWRSQVNLPPVKTLDDQPINRVQVDGQDAGAIDLIEPTAADEADEAKRVIVIILPREDLTWFFKMTGSHALLENNKEAFAAFMKSVKFVPDK